MFRNILRSFTLALAALAVINLTAQAGPPLICHPYEIGDAQSLPWAGAEWRDVKKDYDLNRLVDDTLTLLQANTPVLVRMETLRRAAIYAIWAQRDHEVGYRVKDTKTAEALLARLQERVTASERKGQVDPLALFDAGFFIETWKNAADRNSAPKLDGYAMTTRASQLRNNDAAMEFAAALMTFTDKALQRAHLQKAVAGAPENSLLARNLVRHFGDRGRNIAELRVNVGLAKN
jgi:hypothetical protein